jgi:hypothetical protein
MNKEDNSIRKSHISREDGAIISEEMRGHLVLFPKSFLEKSQVFGPQKL